MKNSLFEKNFFISLLHPFSKQKRQEIRKRISEEKFNSFHKNAPSILRDLSYAINSYYKPVNAWIEFGTLLGAYRENNIIAHDTDIDMGINELDMDEEFIKHLENHNFKLINQFIIESTNEKLDKFKAEYTFRYKNLVNIDFFVFKEVEGKNVCFSFDKEDNLSYSETLKKYNGKLRTIKLELPAHNLKEIDFLGSNFLAPEKIEEHLSEIYGEDFMTPKKYNYENRIKDYEILLDQNTLGKKITVK